MPHLGGATLRGFRLHRGNLVDVRNLERGVEMRVWWGAGIEARTAIVAVSVLVMSGAGISEAQAQSALPRNCYGTVSNTTVNGTPITNLGFLGGSAGAVSSTISGVIGSVNTAFLTQQGSAFVSAPGNPTPDQQGGGIWARSLAGEVTTKSVTSNVGVGTQAAAGLVLNDQCNNSLHQYYSGMQVGSDLSKLNINGWNVHIGATAGFLGSTATDDSSGNGGVRTGVQVPFLGAYVAATYGRFFADLMVRQEFYNLNVDSPNLGILNQPIGAHGVSISASAGYNFALANNWFIEPSAGFIWSNTKVDTFNSAVPDANYATIGGTTTTNDVSSQIGRVSVRVGTTIATPNVVYTPFVSASVLHEFAGDVVSNYAFCPTCAGINGVPAQFSQQSTTTRVGTYGQFSAGLAAQFANTGWVGFVRADYKVGDNIDGYAGNVGLRYQFAPDADASPLNYAKAPLKAPVAASGTTNWTGFYAGVYAGGAYGRADIAMANAAASVGTNTSPYTSGPIGGLQAGYNYQVNNWVLGVEGDVGLAQLHGGRPCGFDRGAGNGFDPLFQECNDRMNWTGTLAGRVGYAYGRTLFYAKGGVAWADGRVDVNCNDGSSVAFNPHCFNVNGNRYPGGTALLGNATDYKTHADYNRVGWMIGYGTEFDLGRNWSAKAEYDYIQFGSQTKTASDGETVLNSRASINQAKIGLNYRFGGGSSAGEAAPLVASTYDWRGFYIGANTGGAIASNNWDMYDAFGFTTPNLLPGYTSEGSHSSSGPVAGGQVGYRAQLGRWVFGVEAQGDWAKLRGENVTPIVLLGTSLWSNQTRIVSLGVFTGQLGYTAFDTLLYLKGGAVVARERYNVFNTGAEAGNVGGGNGAAVLAGTTTDTRVGAAVGAGVEYGFSPNWSAGVDYVHGFLGTKTYDIPNLNGGMWATDEHINQSLDMVTLRLNYKFGPSAVAAKY